MSEPAVGRSIPRLDARAKVTGAARYLADLPFPGAAHARLLRSPFPRARIGALDPRPAAARPGVLAVLTGDDVPAARYGPYLRDQPVLASGEARYEGEPVAVVIAETADEAEAAAQDLAVAWEPLEAATTLEAALTSGGVAVHGDIGAPGRRPAARSAAGDWLAGLGWSAANACHDFERRHGDVERGFAESDHVFEDVFEVPPIQHFALEPFACAARWDGESLEVHSATQSPFGVRRDLARIFGLDLARVTVRVPFVGGGFGGKLHTKIEPICAAAALRVPGRTVKLVLGANESAMTVIRHAAQVWIRTGVTEDGRLLARDCVTLLNTGAYTDAGARVADKAGYRAPGPYRIPHVRSRACAVYTNLPPAGAYRGFGTPQVAWAYESQLDLIAGRLGIDRVEIRRRNLLRRGERFSPDDSPVDCDLHDALDRVAGRIHPGPAPVAAGVGVGWATTLKDGGGQHTSSSAEVRLEEDGSACLLVGATEIGQGVTTAFAQLVADELAIGVDRVLVRLADTALVPFDSGTNASRTVTLVGSAVLQAAGEVRRQLLDAFREEVGLDPGVEVSLRAGVVAGSGHSLTVADLLRRRAKHRGGQLVGTGYYRTEPGDGSLGARTAFWEPGVAAAEVEVDAETGAVRLLRYVSVLDAGRAINPAQCEGQDEGAAMMGFGHALGEELHFDGGQLLNASLTDYRLPSFADLPAEFDTILVENGDGPGPHGARGIGEGGLLPAAPAIGNAIAAATGVRLWRLPMSPEAVWRALRDNADGADAGGAEADGTGPAAPAPDPGGARRAV